MNVLLNNTKIIQSNESKKVEKQSAQNLQLRLNRYLAKISNNLGLSHMAMMK